MKANAFIHSTYVQMFKSTHTHMIHKVSDIANIKIVCVHIKNVPLYFLL